MSATRTTVTNWPRLGVEVVVQASAGEAADALDARYVGVGATIAPDAETLYRDADLVLKFALPRSYPTSVTRSTS